MLIRSQDKTALVKFEDIVVNLKLPDLLNIICWSWQDAQIVKIELIGQTLWLGCHFQNHTRRTKWEDAN